LNVLQSSRSSGFRVTVYKQIDQAATAEITGEVGRLLTVMIDDMKRKDIQSALGLKHEDYFREAYLLPALKAGLIEMTIPDKPRSSKQKYRLTEKGRMLLKKARGE
jgi:hypothetical protein